MTSPTFTECFQAIHGYPPFPWQARLADVVASQGAWPAVIAAPTAAGKTAVIDVALFHLATQAGRPLHERTAPLRIFFVVDRRIVVDGAFERARGIAAALDGTAPVPPTRWMRDQLLRYGGDRPLTTALLRGGVVRDESWTRSLIQPTVCISTVDQVGSRLLFRAYGARRGACNTLPIHAALVGNDALFLLDEAHLSEAFAGTLQHVSRYRTWASSPVRSPFHVVQLSATPRGADAFREDKADRQHPVLRRRLATPKFAVLVPVATKKIALKTPANERRALQEANRGALVEALVEAARRLADDTSAPKVIAVVANRVRTARAVFDQLRQEQDAVLLTGRSRPVDRDALMAEWLPRLAAGRTRGDQSPCVVVATQTIEVGADLDFDALVTECAPLDALRQRFGRLNRLGELPQAPARIVGYPASIDGDPDAVYGEPLIATWKWLNAHATKRGRGRSKEAVIDFGALALDALRQKHWADGIESPPQRAPVLLPAHLDLWAQTSPIPGVDPDLTSFLHGPQSGPPDVSVVWRSDLDELPPADWADVVALLPPSAAETAQIPFAAVRHWLTHAGESDFADIEGVACGDGDASIRRSRPVLRWIGAADAAWIRGDQVRPGDVVVVPAHYGGLDRYGWSPAITAPVLDVAEQAGFTLRGRVVIRFPMAAQDAFDADATLRVEAEGQGRLAQLAQRLLTDRYRVVPYPTGRGVVVLGRRRYGQDVTRGAAAEDALPGTPDLASGSAPVTIEAHCAGVAREVVRHAMVLGVDADLWEALAVAAQWHDVGKADPRFQILLHGGNEMEAALSEVLLAKSGMDPLDMSAWQAARRLSKWPSGGRHEALSLALLDASRPEGGHEALVRHLVTSHHGAARPFLPPVVDDVDELVEVVVEGTPARASTRHGLCRLDGGVGARFWQATRQCGWFGLAYLEALLRLADHQQSAKEAGDD